MKILFSPIGMTDPISQNTLYEGSLLNICRFYEPDKTYLYMSKEVMELHKKDDRYVKCLKRVYSYLKKDFEYEIIDRSTLKRFKFLIFSTRNIEIFSIRSMKKILMPRYY